jgi:hypothetical protein
VTTPIFKLDALGAALGAVVLLELEHADTTSAAVASSANKFRSLPVMEPSLASQHPRFLAEPSYPDCICGLHIRPRRTRGSVANKPIGLDGARRPKIAQRQSGR